MTSSFTLLHKEKNNVTSVGYSKPSDDIIIQSNFFGLFAPGVDTGFTTPVNAQIDQNKGTIYVFGLSKAKVNDQVIFNNITWTVTSNQASWGNNSVLEVELVT